MQKRIKIIYIILSAITFGFIFLFALGYFFGDVDDYGWLFSLIGLITGFISGYFTRNVITISTPLKKIFKLLFVLTFVVTILLMLYGSYGLITMKDLFTGNIYDEMDGLIPLIILFGSFMSLFISLLFGIISKKYE